MEAPLSSEELVTIHVCPDTGEEMVFESLLRDAGIAFVLRPWGLSNFIGGAQIGGGLAPIEVCVAPEDADTARALLADLETAIVEPTDELAEDPDAREMEELPEDAG